MGLRLRKHRFCAYVAHYWQEHLTDLTENCVYVATATFPKSSKHVSSWWQIKNYTSSRSQNFVHYEHPWFSNYKPHHLLGLHFAVILRSQDLVLQSLQIGQPANVRDNNRRTPLSLAAAFGLPHMVELLLTTGNAAVNAKDDRGKTALSYAVENRHVTIVRMLLFYGDTDPRHEDHRGMSPLAYASEDGETEIV